MTTRFLSITIVLLLLLTGGSKLWEYVTSAESGTAPASQVVAVSVIHDDLRHLPVAIPTPAPTLAPTPEPTQAPVVQATPPEYGNSYPDELVQAVCGQGFDWDCDTALAISWREMGRKYNPSAWNPTPVWLNGENHASGCFQLILPFHSGLFDGPWDDCFANARAAYRLYLTNGWQPWCLC